MNRNIDINCNGKKRIVSSKIEVLTIYCFLCHRGECQIEYKQHDLEVLYDAHSNGTINMKKKEDT